MPVIETAARSPEFDTSAAVDLFWMLIEAGRAGRPGSRATDPNLVTLTGDSSLVRRVDDFWDEGPDDFSELLVLADHAGVLRGSHTGEEVVAASVKAAASVPLEPRLGSETAESRRVIRRRLGVLRNDKASRRRYEKLLLDVWAHGAADWSERALPVEMDIVTRCRERSARGANWTELVEDTSRLQGFISDARTRAEESLFLVSISAYGGALLLDLPSAQLIGLRGKDLMHSGKQEETLRIAARLRALSDPTRLSLLVLLTKEELSVGDLAARLDLAQPTVSNHVKVLKEAGLLETHKKNGRQCLAIDKASLDALLDETRRHLSAVRP